MTAPATVAATRLEEILLDPSGPKVVALGGGHGLSITLEAVQSYASEITAVVAVADDGGSSGRLTSGLGIPPPGDIRRCLLALTPEPSVWSELFAYRFQAGDIEDHSLGNLLLAALTDLTGDFGGAVDLAGKLLRTVGKVVPAANEAAALTAVVEGRRVVGQAVITKARGGISAMELGPEELSANPAALAAIATADQIVLGPGSLYTSLMAVLLVPGIRDAWLGSRGKKVFVLNLLGQDGETLGMNGNDHLAALADMAGIEGPGVAISHVGDLDVPVGLKAVSVDQHDAGRWGWRVVHHDVADPEVEWPAHDPIKLGRVLSESLTT
jgi:uncharacterized cofD-like protein